MGGLDGREETRTDSGGGGTDEHTEGAPGLARTSPVTSGKDWGLDYIADVHRQWGGSGDQEWRDTLFLRYGLDPPDLPIHCDRYQAKFSISHALD